MIKKDLQIKEYKEIDDEIIEIMASDESVDRDNDVIKVDGWNINNWLKTGSLLYGHDPSSPYNVMGTAEGYEIRDGKLYLYSKLAKKGTSDTHDAVRSLIDQKILRGVSVGFKSDSWEPNNYGGKNFLKQELLEISLTPIPSNSNAQVIKQFGKDICDSLIQDEEDNIVENKEVEALREEISLQDKAMVKLMKQLDDQEEKYKELLKRFLSKDGVQEETKAVEPEPNTLSKEQRFLELIHKNNSGE